MTEDQIIDKMLEFGLNKYEAKAYVALTKKSDVTAYELSKLSGVPQAKIYETMNRLLDKNLVNIIGDNPTKYIPVDLDGFLDNYQENIEDSVSFLKTNLRKINDHKKVSYLWHIEGRDNLVRKIKTMLHKAKKTIYMEAWSQDFEFFFPHLEEAQDQGVGVVSIIYGATEHQVGQMHYHEMEGMDQETMEVGRWFTLVIDGAESLFAVFKSPGNEEGIWTENKAFMLMAESFIAHDIFIAEIYSRFRNELNETFGPNMKHIRGYIRNQSSLE